MEFTCRKDDLVRELALSQRIVEKRNTIPILANVLIEAAKDSVSISATDLEVGFRGRCAAQVKSAGAITVSAKKLFEIVRALPEEDVRIKSTESSGMNLRCGKSEFRLVGLDAKDFPNLPACDFRNAWESPPDLFHGLLSKVLFAVTTDESRFPISGVLFLVSKKHVTVVATDGHRLALAEADRGFKGLTAETRLILPKKALVEVKQIAELGIEKVECEIKENHIYFNLGDRLLVARMVEDQFPAYEKVIPKNNDRLVSVEREALESAVRRASVLAAEKARSVRLQFRPGVLEISASNPEQGEAREEVPIEFEGEVVDTAYNAQYILDFLAVVDTPRVQIDLKDGSTQAILRPGPAAAVEGEEAERSSKEVRYYYVLMPMRL